jgi:GNAT superfamily N-acetyltransferase
MDTAMLLRTADDGAATSVSLKCCKAKTLSKSEKDSIIDLTEVNVRSFYEATWGWDKDAKSKELFHPSSYFLLVQSADQALVAFSMFKFTWDDEDEPEFPVLFTYELQVNEKFRGGGIGRKLMDLEKKIAYEHNMWKVMLTCFKVNSKAMSFYERIGFGVDINSPSVHGVDTDYEILSDRPNRKS